MFGSINPERLVAILSNEFRNTFKAIAMEGYQSHLKFPKI